MILSSFTDTPGPVSDLKVSDVTKTSCHVSWAPPENDGGSQVTHYIVQKRDADRKTWSTVTPEVKKTSFHITNLVPGTEYFFRVTAVNEYGPGVPTDIPKPVLATDPLSKLHPFSLLLTPVPDLSKIKIPKHFTPLMKGPSLVEPKQYK